MKQNKTGKVIFAGAGPGDPELITYKAIIALKKADVVLTDRLVSPDILKRYVSSSAQIIFVGKQAYRFASVSQTDIDNLMVRFAKEGKMVVRLKGGDVSIFSNILSELEALKHNNISYEIIPGITAASGAAAYSGIPLTARSYASSVRYLCYYKHESFKESYWKELAETEDTLVFYMTGENITDLIENLTSRKINSKKLIAVVEQATTPLQNVFVTNPYKFINKPGRKITSPSIVIIGKVVALHHALGWMKNSNSSAEYFDSVEKKLINYEAEPQQELLTA